MGTSEKIISQISFGRAYLISRKNYDNNNELTKLPLCKGWSIYLGKNIVGDYCKESNGSSMICIIGKAVDCRDYRRGSKEIAKSISNARDINFGNIEKELYYTGGRYVLVASIGEETRIYGDSTNLKSIFYSSEEISSHASLLAKNLCLGPGDYKIGREKRLYHRTPWPEVNLLQCNHYLSFDGFRIKRFFPKDKLCSLDLDSATYYLDIYLSNFMRGVSSKWKTVFSLTAGLDSRVTASLAKYTGIDAFTYGSDKKTEVDRKMARLICDRLSLPHHELKSANKDASKTSYSEFKAALRNASYLEHNVSVAYNYFSNLSYEVHLRSNIAEIGRNYYKNVKHVEKLDIDSVIKIGSYDRNDIYSINEMSRYLENSEFNKLPEGYDPLDMFYWEFRMTGWHSVLSMESDPTFDTIALFNSHCILDIMLSVEERYKDSGYLLKSIISRKSPEIQYLPINPKQM